MYRNIDVLTEMRKLTSSKPAHAVAGAGVLASQTLRDLPGLLVRWGSENPVTSLPSRATGYAQTRASEYVRSARAKATDGYDTLAARGRKALNGAPHAAPARSTESKSSQAHSGTAKSAQSKSTTAGQGKTASNGKAKGKGKTTSRSTASH